MGDKEVLDTTRTFGAQKVLPEPGQMVRVSEGARGRVVNRVRDVKDSVLVHLMSGSRKAYSQYNLYPEPERPEASGETEEETIK